jgi:hypothetical protein
LQSTQARGRSPTTAELAIRLYLRYLRRTLYFLLLGKATVLRHRDCRGPSVIIAREKLSIRAEGNAGDKCCSIRAVVQLKRDMILFSDSAMQGPLVLGGVSRRRKKAEGPEDFALRAFCIDHVSPSLSLPVEHTHIEYKLCDQPRVWLWQLR